MPLAIKISTLLLAVCHAHESSPWAAFDQRPAHMPHGYHYGQAVVEGLWRAVVLLTGK